MDLNVNKIDSANAVIKGVIAKKAIDEKLTKVAKSASKNLKVDGFRKGKVPAHIIKARYGDKLQEDATSEALRDFLQVGLKQLDVKNDDLIGEPAVSKFVKKDDGSVEVEIKISCKPNIELGDYKSLMPEVKKQTITKKEVESKLKEISAGSAPLEKIKRKRAAKNDDYCVIDFEGFVDGVAFAGGKAEKYTLQLGSNSFIPGFEDQIIGMKYEEEREIKVQFPKAYHSKDLAGKDAIFKVVLHEIQEKQEAVIDDEFAKKMLPNEKDATVELLSEKIKEQLANEKKGSYYRDELKPVYIDKLVKELDFAVPESIVDQEINIALNNKVRTMNEKEIKALQKDSTKIETMRDELRDEAQKSVKATFIIDALAKAENIAVSDQEVSQIIYFEALQTGQNPQEVLKKYQDAGYLPAIKMSIIEDKVLTKLFDEKLGKK